MTDPTPLNAQADRIAAAKKAQAAREQGIHANAVKQGRTLERAELLKQLGVQKLEDASQVASLRAERDARPTPDAEHKHVRGAMGWGMLWGVITGFALATVVILTMQGMIWDTAARSFREQAMTGAMLSTQDERQ